MADDDAMLRKLAEVWFSRMGFHVLMAGDGEEGLALARRVHPAAIISDALMPKMDGFTEEAIVQHGVLNPGILLLNKPFTADTLDAIIREALGR